MSCWCIAVVLLMRIISLSSSNLFKGTVHHGFYNCQNVELILIDRVLCEWKCYKRVNCKSVTYDDADNSCCMYIHRGTYSYTGSNTSTITMMRHFEPGRCSTGIIHPRVPPASHQSSSMLQCPVLNMSYLPTMLGVRSLTADLANWTNVTADEYCNKLGTRLATYDEILPHISLGYGKYSCGMIASGIGVITNNNTLNNCTFQATHAWCKGL